MGIKLEHSLSDLSKGDSDLETLMWWRINTIGTYLVQLAKSAEHFSDVATNFDNFFEDLCDRVDAFESQLQENK